MNITEIAQLVTNVIQNGANVVKRLFDMHYNPTPMDIELPWIDENGQLTTYKVPNDAKKRQTYLDIIGAAIAKMSVMYYVDAENGDDLNPGTSDAPFKTLQKAINAIPTGGYGVINVKENQTHIINSNFNCYNKVIYIARWGFNTDIKPVVTHDWYVGDDDLIHAYGIRFRNAYVFTSKVDFETAKIEDTEGKEFALDTSFFKRADNLSYNFYISYAEIKINEFDFIRQPLGPAQLVDFTTYSVNVYKLGNSDIREGSLIKLEGGTANLKLASSHVYDADGNELTFGDVIAGIVKDPDSGNPINLISNLNFSD